MSLVDRFGIKAVAEKRQGNTDPQMAKDIALIGYRAQGMSFEAIGRIFNVSRQAIHKRWRAIPPDARRYYAGRAVG
jgi:hypothetical protein